MHIPLQQHTQRPHQQHGWPGTVLILAALTGLLMLIGYTVSGTGGALIALGVAVAPMLFNPMNSPGTVLRMNGARPIPRWQAPVLYEAAAELARRAGLQSAPGLYYIDSPALNALTVGSTRASAIALTDGLLRAMPGREMSAVLAHEIAHLQNHDLWIMGVAASFARLTEWLSVFGQWMVLLSLPVVAVTDASMPWGALGVLVLAPVASGLLRLALSRTREYDADLGAARLLGSARPLATALARMEHRTRRMLPPILRPQQARAPEWLQTHPATEERIRRLLAMDDETLAG